ncbi:MAG: TIGR02147 family protein [Bdellovibrionales bacterium]|nr:TIGR02147 family protein [Bdellovibrionales bacterium]
MIFKYLDYREYLKSLTSKQSPYKNYNYQTLANIMRIQKSYLSRVMKKEAHLSQDQCYLLSSHLQLNSSESRYFELMVEYQRTGLENRRHEIVAHLKRIQVQQIKSEKFLNKNLQSSSLEEYYTNPILQILHIALLLDGNFEYKNKIIQTHMGLSEEQVQASIQKLLDLKVLSKRGSLFINEAKGMHLKYNSPLTPINHSLLRGVSMQHLLKLGIDSKYSFSTTFSAHQETFTIIKSEFFKFLTQIEQPIGAAPAKNCYQINFDLFPWITGEK